MNRFEKWSVWITSALTVLTGVGYFVTKYLFTASDPYAVVSHPWQPFFLKAHILVSPLLLFALGIIAIHHVWKHFVSGIRWSRRSGVITALAVLPMVLTGYLIQALTDAGWVSAMAWAHIGFGFLYGLGLVVHTWMIRRGPEPKGRKREAARRNFSDPVSKYGVEEMRPDGAPRDGGASPVDGASPSGGVPPERRAGPADAGRATRSPGGQEASR
jgi:hypothetical protein